MDESMECETAPVHLPTGDAGSECDTAKESVPAVPSEQPSADAKEGADDGGHGPESGVRDGEQPGGAESVQRDPSTASGEYDDPAKIAQTGEGNGKDGEGDGKGTGGDTESKNEPGEQQPRRRTPQSAAGPPAQRRPAGRAAQPSQSRGGRGGGRYAHLFD